MQFFRDYCFNWINSPGQLSNTKSRWGLLILCSPRDWVAGSNVQVDDFRTPFIFRWRTKACAELQANSAVFILRESIDSLFKFKPDVITQVMCHGVAGILSKIISVFAFHDCIKVSGKARRPLDPEPYKAAFEH
jgi:hypothetical protein